MSARLLLIILLTCTAVKETQAQGLGGLFSQKYTDLKLVGQQIALIRLYEGWLEKGYHVARAGLTAIGDVKRGDLALHTEYFNDMKTANSSLTGWKILTLIARREALLLRYCQAARDQPRLNSTENELVRQTTASMMENSAQTIAELFELLNGQVLKLSDDERIKRLQKLNDTSTRRLRKAIDLRNEAVTLSANRQTEENNIELLQRLKP